jgi:DNA-binding SARP family transcriptional activator
MGQGGTHLPAVQDFANRLIVEQRLLISSVEQLLDSIRQQEQRLNRQLEIAVGLLTGDASVRRGGRGTDEASDGTDALQHVHVRCFGQLELVIGGTAVREWRLGKARALFEYLVMHRGRPVGRDTLIEALWPDPDAVAGGNSLKVAVHSLRQTLQSVTRVTRTDAISVVAHESGYQLVAPALWLDVDEFERLCILGARSEHEHRHDDALQLYAAATELYRGDFLADSWDDWIVLRREGLKDQYLLMLGRLADAALDAGDYQTCIQRCRQILEQDRCREDAFRALMLCHTRLGQPGRVRRWYQLCTRMMRAELDLEPSSETVEIYQAMRTERGRRSVTGM